ncbi:MAG: PqqD family peptide modification chaperone [Chloroflexi bacterium]|nr:PqqD family peptide modification chaperone [Chloroflexota bacterium]
MFHYQIENADEKSRVHLRLDPDGHGTLIINANRVMHLNPTAAFMAKAIFDGKADAEILKSAAKKWKVASAELKDDLAAFHYQLSELIRPDGACAIHDLELETLAPFSARPSAPYRMDLALTYRCNNDCHHCYNARERSFAELDTDHWKQLLDKTWALAIPHVVFTGGEPTLRDDLPELIAHAEGNGQISGLNTNARRLSDPNFVKRLVDAGLDHVQVTVESCDADIHNRMVNAKAFEQTIKGLKNALDTRLFVMTNTTMLQDNVHSIPATLDFLAELGVPTIGLNALIHSGHGATVGTGLPESELTPLLEIARQKTDARGQRLIWYTPTQYCGFDPMALDLGVKGCTAALYNMCVEPNGDVLPCQSYYRPVGNLLRDDWDAIWNHKLSVKLRERQDLPLKCEGCALLSDCGGGCPLQFSIGES